MKLLPNEEKLITANRDNIVLTNHRIQLLERASWWQTYIISIFLEDISSIEKKYSHNIVYLALSIFAIIPTLYFKTTMNDNFMVASGVVAIIFFILWLSSRKHIIQISSNGGSSIKILLSGMSRDDAEDFIYNVSLAKQKRINQLGRIN